MKNVTFILLFSSAVLALSHFSTQQKQKYLYPLGKRIFQEQCTQISHKNFDSFEALYSYIQRSCNLDEKRYVDALAWYLWDKKHIGSSSKEELAFHYTKEDKCPVCGMFVYKYPNLVAMADNGKKKELYFDGVKDMLKYYFAHKKDELKLYAQDYYSKKIIELHDAWLVLGSDVYGPMGEEIIPFASKKEAQSFLLDHHGKRIVKLHQLDKTSIEALDE